MGVMLRVAGIPTRVVLGYEHPTPDPNGNFTVSTNDAHSWVEAYFSGLGWVPFDPTPIDGLAGGPANDLPYAPHPAYTGGAIDPSIGAPKGRNSLNPSVNGGKNASHQPGGANSGVRGSISLAPVLWTVAIVLVAAGVLLLPAGLRLLRRRRRLLAARHGDADALWAELSDTAVDLGYVWSPARSPRQVAIWLSRERAGRRTGLARTRRRRRAQPLRRRPERSGRLGADRRPAHGHRRRCARGAATACGCGPTLWPASLGWGRLPGRARRR